MMIIFGFESHTSGVGFSLPVVSVVFVSLTAVSLTAVSPLDVQSEARDMMKMKRLKTDNIIIMTEIQMATTNQQEMQMRVSVFY